MGRPRDMVRRWWRDPVNYSWLISMLEAHSVYGLVRAVAVCAGMLVLGVVVATFMSAGGPSGVVAQSVFAGLIVLNLLWMLRWYLRPPPSAAESLATLVVVDVMTTLGCLMCGNRLYIATSVVLLVLVGVFLSFFHGPRSLAAHAGWSVFSATLYALVAARGDPDADTAWVIALIAVMVVAVVVILPTVQFSYWLLRMDSFTDPLTRLLNRRGLDYYLSEWFARQRGKPMCLMVVDLDNFKRINDLLGHPAGDAVLVRVADRLRAHVAPSDIVARIGGEEFVVVRRLNRPQSVTAAERVRHAVEVMEQLPVPVTVSVGVATLDGGRPAVEDLLHCADAAMYEAKRLGRNRIVMATADI
ncbi:GGDEF domain-containing protein [Nocardia sp. NPDC020380]|uniref:GGDEF domain-containing protein n=1 Tax=Nocardia sp. NPDC020380 TaxID=3364309 RepID=UPI003795F746